MSSITLMLYAKCGFNKKEYSPRLFTNIAIFRICNFVDKDVYDATVQK
jgi:hypothetical protein